MYELIVLVMIIWLIWFIWRFFKQFGESDSLNDNPSGPSTTSNQSRMSVKTKYDYELETYERELRLQEKRRQRERDRREKERQLTKNALEAQARTLDRLNNINKNDDMHEYTQEMSQRAAEFQEQKKRAEQELRLHKRKESEKSERDRLETIRLQELAAEREKKQAFLNFSETQEKLKRIRQEEDEALREQFMRQQEHDDMAIIKRMSKKELDHLLKKVRKKDQARLKYVLKHQAAEFLFFTSGLYSLTPTQLYNIWRYRNSKKTDDRCRNITGVYVIQNHSKNKYYVGQSSRVFTRVMDHFSIDGRGKFKGNPGVFKDFISGDAFSISVRKLSDTPFDNLDDLEKCLIKWYDAFDSGYNKNKGNGKLMHVPKNPPQVLPDSDQFFKTLTQMRRKQSKQKSLRDAA